MCDPRPDSINLIITASLADSTIMKPLTMQFSTTYSYFLRYGSKAKLSRYRHAGVEGEGNIAATYSGPRH
jgi:hypothetical protein